MLKTTKSGVTYSYPIHSATPIKVEGRYGTWYIIDACLNGDSIYALLENEQYGDETALLLVKLPKTNNCYMVREDRYGNVITKTYYLRSKFEIAETYDDIIESMIDNDLIDDEDDCDMLSDEEIDDMEVI